jgi:hypothetical protein
MRGEAGAGADADGGVGAPGPRDGWVHAPLASATASASAGRTVVAAGCADVHATEREF